MDERIRTTLPDAIRSGFTWDVTRNVSLRDQLQEAIDRKDKENDER